MSSTEPFRHWLISGVALEDSPIRTKLCWRTAFYPQVKMWKMKSKVIQLDRGVTKRNEIWASVWNHSTVPVKPDILRVPYHFWSLTMPLSVTVTGSFCIWKNRKKFVIMTKPCTSLIRGYAALNFLPFAVLFQGKHKNTMVKLYNRVHTFWLRTHTIQVDNYQ